MTKHEKLQEELHDSELMHDKVFALTIVFGFIMVIGGMFLINILPLIGTILFIAGLFCVFSSPHTSAWIIAKMFPSFRVIVTSPDGFETVYKGKDYDKQ